MRETGSGSQSRGKYSRKYTEGKPYGKAGESRDKAARRRQERRFGENRTGGGPQKKPETPQETAGNPSVKIVQKSDSLASEVRTDDSVANRPGQPSADHSANSTTCDFLSAVRSATCNPINNPARNTGRDGQRPGLRTTRQFEPAARPAAHRKPARSANQARNTGHDGQKPGQQLTANRRSANPARNTSRDSAKGPTRGTTRSSGSAAGPELGADHSSSAGST